MLHRGQLFALSLGQQAQILFISSLYEVSSNEDSMMTDSDLHSVRAIRIQDVLNGFLNSQLACACIQIDGPPMRQQE